MDLSLFSGFSTSLDNLSSKAKQSVSEIIFSHRQGVLSVCVVVTSLSDLKLITNNIPAYIKKSKAKRYAVDLESIGTTKQRFYIDCKKENISIEGFYFENNNLYESKVYKRNGIDSLLIDRFDSNGVLISANEEEIASNSASWTGGSDIITAAENSGYTVVYLKKVSKDQSYIRIF